MNRIVQLIVAVSFLTLLIAQGCNRPASTPESTIGTSCITAGAEDWQARCQGDDLLYCVCDDYQGSQCPSGEGHWVQQSILCTCSEWQAGRCPVE